MKKWKSITKHPLKKDKDKGKEWLYPIDLSSGLYMKQSEKKKGVVRFTKVELPSEELELLKEIKLL